MKNHLSFSATIDTLDNKEWFREWWVGKSSDHNLAEPSVLNIGKLFSELKLVEVSMTLELLVNQTITN